MKALRIGLLIAVATTLVTGPALAQRYLDDYVGQPINAAKDDLRRQGFRDAGHISNRRGTYALMFDGRSCIALHGGRGVIDEIDRFDPRDCDRRREDRRDWDRPPRY